MDGLEASTGHVGVSLTDLWSTGHDARCDEWSTGQLAVDDDDEHDEAMSVERTAPTLYIQMYSEKQIFVDNGQFTLIVQGDCSQIPSTSSLSC